MKIGSIQISSNKNKFGIDFELMHLAGFNSIDLQNFMSVDSELYLMNDAEFSSYLKELKSESKKYKLKIHQLHSMWVYPPQKYDDVNKLDSTLQYYVRAIEGAKILGCKYVVLHHRFPFEFNDYENQNKLGEKINIEFLEKLLPIAMKNKIYLCLENLPFGNIDFCNIEGTLKIVNYFNSKYLGICLDTGHYNVVDKNKNIYDVVNYINKKLYCLHIHDNDGTTDSHLMPGLGNMDWKLFKKALNDIHFKGVFSFETISKSENCSTRLKEEQELVQFARSL